MKKIVLTASVLSVLAVSASAQTTSKMNVGTKTTFGIHAGANMFTITGENSSGADVDYKLNTGFSGGVNAEIPIGGGAYLQPGVSFVQKGAEYSNGAKTTLNYIDIPVNFIYKPVLGSGTLVLGAGPYLGIGIGGKVKNANNTKTDVEFNDSYNLSSNAPQFKRTDAGANFLAGYEFANNLSVNLKAQLGLKDINIKIANITNDQTSLKNTGFGLGLGYRF